MMGQEVVIETCVSRNLDEWSGMRAELWPDGCVEEHRRFAEDALSDPTRFVAFLARERRGAPLGFAEATLRFDYVNGASTSPVAFLDGLYVRAAARRRGIARGLVAAIEQWATERGCVELASDASLNNATSHLAHDALGLAETERVVYFLKRIDRPSAQ